MVSVGTATGLLLLGGNLLANVSLGVDMILRGRVGTAVYQHQHILNIFAFLISICSVTIIVDETAPTDLDHDISWDSNYLLVCFAADCCSIASTSTSLFILPI